jgi:hypothetical protein
MKGSVCSRLLRNKRKSTKNVQYAFFLPLRCIRAIELTKLSTGWPIYAHERALVLCFSAPRKKANKRLRGDTTRIVGKARRRAMHT